MQGSVNLYRRCEGEMKEEKHKGDWTYPPYKLGMYIFWIVLIIVIVILMWFPNVIADHTVKCYISNSTYDLGRVCEWR